jgi:epoxide hydrolase 4
MTTTTPDTFTSPATDADTGLREGYAEIGDVELHYVEAGDGPLVVLLHGFPEFWYGWRQQIAPLVKAGFRVVAPDLRGYRQQPGLADTRIAAKHERLPALVNPVQE